MGVALRIETVTIPVEGKEQTSGILTLPEKGAEKTGLIVAHGAGNDMHTSLLAAYAEGLALEGYPVLRFNFLYSDRGKKSPGRTEALYAAWHASHQFFKNYMGSEIDSVVAAGKSMGGRIAAEMVAQGLLPVERLIFLGYPLHPAGDKDKLRDARLYLIEKPMLFFAGTRDPLCDLSLLEPVLEKLRVPWELFTIERGDHSFHVPKSSGITDKDIYCRITAKSVEWLSRSF
ncbi:MAG TPA: alpha/beta family hydrolase [Syntrophorhabdaceae bacterium]|jgi:hypothetical protein